MATPGAGLGGCGLDSPRHPKGLLSSIKVDPLTRMEQLLRIRHLSAGANPAPPRSRMRQRVRGAVTYI